ncbi:MAG: bifunctional lysylphosphatidylglycerol flippase/synthetase MprF [Hyphomonadaceae bacterium]|nr:bifunctional lysylphosphatidylglycerol flippase/synthetase MprF [Hyphomonadaceae bacterium]
MVQARKQATERGDAIARALDAAFDAAPSLAAMLAFTFGAMALIVTATPATPHIPALSAIERVVEELPEFTLSVAGVGLAILAVGLQRRLDAAWAASAGLLAFVTLEAFLRHGHLIAGTLCASALALLLIGRRAFYRRSGLAGLLRSRDWHLPLAAALGMAIVAALLWASAHPAFIQAPWWSLFTDPHLGRPGRALFIACAAGAAIAFWSTLAAPAREPPHVGDSAEIAKARALMAQAQAARPEMHLALTGDKSFIFVESAFVMCAHSGGSLVAMGGPVGARASWRAALEKFRDEAAARALRPVVYAAPVDLLPELLDLGFQAQKVGENAIIDLQRFTLEGARRQPLRNARNRVAEREGGTFEVHAPPQKAHLLDELQPVSDAWLAAHKGGEKGFSLGWFDRDYLTDQTVALVRVRGRVVAFANVWTTPDHAWAAIDLMRYEPAHAPPRTMEFLFAELFLWAKQEGYRKFDLGMAPLSGLAEERHAPAFARLGRLVYERGAAFYDFRGLRTFKEKFDPDWEPRYLAAPGAWSLPIVLAEAALLTASAPAQRA